MSQAASTIIVVSPSPAASRLLELLLHRAGHASKVAADTDVALDWLAVAAPPLIVIDLRDPDEEFLFFAALVQKRHPAVPRLLLHVGQVRLVNGDDDQVFAVGDEHGVEHFPTIEQLRDLVARVTTDRLLTALRPQTGRA